MSSSATRHGSEKTLLALCLAVLACFTSLPAVADAPLDTDLDPDWKLISDRSDIQVYMRHR
ncbi:MAG: hypothetical protein KDH99_11575, partial [Alcanivoracaceae bacterium]|nr:hypothetical protein [Alcanivoracaceae bacterium]